MSAPRLLDLTRSLRRMGGAHTGIDRVERAYLDHFVASDIPCFGLIRSAFGYLLLDRSGMAVFQAVLDGAALPKGADLLSRLPRGRHHALAQAETHLRAQAVGRAVPFRLVPLLRRHLAEEFAYLNVGHSNLSARVLDAVHGASGTVHVLVHDIIPLEHPEFQRPGTVKPFRDRMLRVAGKADRVIYNSDDTRARAEAWMQAQAGRVPPAVVAHLGVTVATPAPCEAPLARPYFVTVGTIEPRKNHAFLLDLWADWGADAPGLLICGARGWENRQVFARLDALDQNGPIRELASLSDGALAGVIQRANGVLFPSLAEGFGLPPLEARMLGARVLCNDLPVFREVLGRETEILTVSKPENWLRTLKSWEKSPPEAVPSTGFEAPTWGAHFKTVLRLT